MSRAFFFFREKSVSSSFHTRTTRITTLPQSVSNLKNWGSRPSQTLQTVCTTSVVFCTPGTSDALQNFLFLTTAVSACRGYPGSRNESRHTYTERELTNKKRHPRTATMWWQNQSPLEEGLGADNRQQSQSSGSDHSNNRSNNASSRDQTQDPSGGPTQQQMLSWLGFSSEESAGAVTGGGMSALAPPAAFMHSPAVSVNSGMGPYGGNQGMGSQQQAMGMGVGGYYGAAGAYGGQLAPGQGHQLPAPSMTPQTQHQQQLQMQMQMQLAGQQVVPPHPQSQHPNAAAHQKRPAPNTLLPVFGNMVFPTPDEEQINYASGVSSPWGGSSASNPRPKSGSGSDKEKTTDNEFGMSTTQHKMNEPPSQKDPSQKVDKRPAIPELALPKDGSDQQRHRSMTEVAKEISGGVPVPEERGEVSLRSARQSSSTSQSQTSSGKRRKKRLLDRRET